MINTRSIDEINYRKLHRGTNQSTLNSTSREISVLSETGCIFSCLEMSVFYMPICPSFSPFFWIIVSRQIYVYSYLPRNVFKFRVMKGFMDIHKNYWYILSNNNKYCSLYAENIHYFVYIFFYRGIILIRIGPISLDCQFFEKFVVKLFRRCTCLYMNFAMNPE